QVERQHRIGSVFGNSKRSHYFGGLHPVPDRNAFEVARCFGTGCLRSHARKHKQCRCRCFHGEVPAQRKPLAARINADPRANTRAGGRNATSTADWIAARRSFLASTSPGRTKPPGRTQSPSRTFGHVIMPTPPIHSTDRTSHSR